MKFVQLPGGTFRMGENPDDKFANDTERPVRKVTVAPFALADTPVTVAEFRAFKPEHEPDSHPDWPVVMVSAEEARAFCRWMGGVRLPTEAEWEYAARAGSETLFPWGNTIEPTQANYLYSEEGRRIGLGHRTPVRSYPPNNFGLYDLVGNVCEWVDDPWKPSYTSPPDPYQQTLRGGAWDYLPRLLRVTWRDRLPPDQRRDNIGFRLAQ
jgi:formylglycine-generating enzyme required for sulfatase activity